MDGADWRQQQEEQEAQEYLEQIENQRKLKETIENQGKNYVNGNTNTGRKWLREKRKHATPESSRSIVDSGDKKTFAFPFEKLENYKQG